MKKIPSYLKGLVETRARAAADIERLRRTAGEVAAELEMAENNLAAADRLIVLFDPTLRPAKIPSIKAQGQRYGMRGALIAALRAYLASHAEEGVTTLELATAMKAWFDLDFRTAKAESRWVKHSIANRLRKWVKEGLVERMHDARDPSVAVGRWRWKGDCVPSLGRLAEQAAAQGVAVHRYGDDRA